MGILFVLLMGRAISLFSFFESLASLCLTRAHFYLRVKGKDDSADFFFLFQRVDIYV